MADHSRDDHERASGDGHSHDPDHTHAHDHDHHRHEPDRVSVAVLTVSSSRTPDDDPAGDAIVGLLASADRCHLAERELVADDASAIRDAVGALAATADAVVTTGGTGITPDDVTVDAARALFDSELPGFGELFRRLSYEAVGTRAIATRATAGVVDQTPVFCLPGSENAATLGTRDIVVPEAPHLVGLATRETA